MSQILDFKRRAEALGLCQEYRDKWDACSDKEALVRAALDANGIEFLADAVAFGWGVPIDYISSEFGDYAHGQYCRQGDGYSSRLYVDSSSGIRIDTTLTLLVRCGCQVIVPKGHACKVYVCGGSDLVIENQGYLQLYVYGSDKQALVVDAKGAKSIRTDITESSWVRGRKDLMQHEETRL